MERKRCAAGRGGVGDRSVRVRSVGAPEVRRTRGALEVYCRRADVEAWSSGALEARYMCRDVETWRREGLETHYRSSDVKA